MRKYPIGIQEFKKIRTGDYLYIDKTPYIYSLLTEGSYYFLSRPRRFGKSLLLSTIKEIYQGSQDLFSGLWIEDQWDWDKKHPVFHLSFNVLQYKELGLQKALMKELDKQIGIFDLGIEEETVAGKFRLLLQTLGAEQKVVLLIDEYDKPIIDYLNELDQADENRGILKNFYSVIKDSDAYIEFMLLTGVSRFSKVSIFSDLNHLTDLTLEPQMNSLVGITQDELVNVLEEELEQIALDKQITLEELKDKIRYWYNGYSWDGITTVYNPFSLLSFFRKKHFQNFWFDTGTPTFLVDYMRHKGVYDISTTLASEAALNNFDIHRLDMVTLLFQTGYLTIQSYNEEDLLYTLDYPNKEVRQSLQQHLLSAYGHYELSQALPSVIQLRNALRQANIAEVVEMINTTFSSIPYDLWQQENERFYHALVHLTFSLLGAYIRSEVHTSRGRCDALVETSSHIFVLEFKLDQSAEEALQQIEEKGYFAAYVREPKTKIAVGINFSKEQKKVMEWKEKEI